MNRLSIKYCTLFLLLTVSVYSQVEKKPKPNGLDNQYTPDKNSVFNSDGSSYYRENEFNMVKNNIKLNPFLLTRSIVALFYERTLFDAVSLQGGFGVSLTKDFIWTSFNDEIGNEGLFSSPQSSIGIIEMFSNSSISKPSAFVSIGSRFNWNGELSTDEWNPYFELNVRSYSNFLKLNSSSDYYSSSSLVESALDRDVKVKNTLFNFIYGTQYCSTGKIKTVHDFYWGLGVRNSSYDSFKTKEILKYDSSSGSYYNVTTNTQTGNRESVLTFSFLFGYAFGFGF